MKQQYTITGSIVKRKGAKTSGYSCEIGSADAALNDDLMTKELRAALVQIGSKLIEQLNCDAVCFNGLTFQRMWNRNK